MIRHENHLLADDSHDFCRKLGKILQDLSSAAVVIGALRVEKHMTQYTRIISYKTCFIL